MLSYRHSFHAGNFADVLKHIVLIEILNYLSKKDKAYAYIDTHGGAGLYDLNSDHAQKLNEYQHGIAQLKKSEWPELECFFDVINACNNKKKLQFYPGSPLIAQSLMRDQDKATVYELHPTDYSLLVENTKNDRRIKVVQDDGLKGVLSLLPPASRRALILIDPSYEIKTDYQHVIKTIQAAHKKFSTGIYALWYPVVDRDLIDTLERDLQKSGIRDVQRFEFGLQLDSPLRGMTAAGMIVVNPPWGLYDKMSNVLPKLVKTSNRNDVNNSNEANYKCDVLVSE